MPHVLFSWGRLGCLQGMTGGTIGGIVVSDLILGERPAAPAGASGSWAQLCPAGPQAPHGEWRVRVTKAVLPARPAGRKSPWADVYDPSRAPPFKSLLEVGLTVMPGDGLRGTPSRGPATCSISK